MHLWLVQPKWSGLVTAFPTVAFGTRPGRTPTARVRARRQVGCG